MDRIVVSRPALAVAVALAPATPPHTGGTAYRLFSDWDVAAQVGLQPDSVYRGLRELRSLGAVVHYSRPRWPSGPRTVVLNRDHWLWATVGGVA